MLSTMSSLLFKSEALFTGIRRSFPLAAAMVTDHYSAFWMGLYRRLMVFPLHGPPRSESSSDGQINSRVPNGLDFDSLSNFHRIVCDQDEAAHILDEGGSDA
jgi:hypothetical protein